MSAIEITALIIWAVFYSSFFIKMILLRRRGIDGNLLGRGEKPDKARRVERLLKTVSFGGASLQFFCVFLSESIRGPVLPEPLRIIGLLLAAAGTACFIAAMTVMKTNWRSGCDLRQDTSLVVEGPYKFSRNPAFVGFDLLYIGWALVFPNIINLTVSALALAAFHLQILEEEKFLETVFGQKFLNYKAGTNRYFGRPAR